jgi:hypothetical protein
MKINTHILSCMNDRVSNKCMYYCTSMMDRYCLDGQRRKSVFILNIFIIRVNLSLNMSQHQLHLFEFK